MREFTLTEFAAHCLTMGADVELAKEAAVEKGCQMIEKEAKASLGHYHLGWPRLKPATIARKATGDSPLLETGQLRDSIGHVVLHEEGEVVGYVGSDDDVAIYQELGTSRIPARPFLAGAATREEKAVVEMTGRMIEGAMIRGGSNYRELREILAVLHEVGHEVKKTFEEATKQPDDDDGRQ